MKTFNNLRELTGRKPKGQLIVNKKIEQAIFIDANINALKKCQLYHKEYFSSKTLSRSSIFSVFDN